MYYKYIPGTWVLVICFFIITTLGLYSVVYRKLRGAKVFGLCMLFLGLWTISYGLEISGVAYASRRFWANMSYCLFIAIHLCWFVMVLQLAAPPKWLRLKRLIPALLFPALTMVLVWMKQFYGLSYYGFILDSGTPFPVLQRTFSWLILINPIYIYALDFVSVVLVIKKTVFYKSIYGMNSVAFLFSPVICLSPSFLYLMSFWLIKGYDITMIYMGLAVVLMAIGGYYLFVAAPIAREAAVDNIDIAMLVVNSVGKIADVNVAARRMFNHKRKTLLGMPAEELLVALGIDINSLEIENTKEFEIAADNTGQTLYYMAQRLPIVNKRGIQAGFIILIYDVTQIRLERARQMQQNSNAVATKERERLARDLHDNLAQILASISLQAQGICNELKYEETEKLYRDLTRLVDVSQSAHREIREYIHYVKDPSNWETDLIKAIRTSAEEFHAQSGIPIGVHIDESELLDQMENERKANLQYIVKEALNNIRKHANAKQVDLRMKKIDDSLHISIEDNGTGFDQDKSTENRYGLRIMRERAEEIGAQINIQTEIGVGTRIDLVVPLS